MGWGVPSERQDSPVPVDLLVAFVLWPRKYRLTEPAAPTPSGCCRLKPKKGSAGQETNIGLQVAMEEEEEEWEEPHPGLRLSFSSATTSLPHACDHACEAREAQNEPGIATGESTARFGRPKAPGSTSRRLARLWLRPTSAKSVHCCCRACTSVLETTRDPDTSFSPAISRAHSADCVAQLGPESESTAEADPRSKSPSCVAEITASSELSLPPLQKAESPGEHDAERGAEFEADNEKASFVSLERGGATDSDLDPYGWEAELKKREGCSIAGLGRKRDGKKKCRHGGSTWALGMYRHIAGRHVP